MRLDKYVYECGLTQSRQQAKVMIESGNIYVNGSCVTKPAYDIEEGNIEIRGEVMPYVSRGGLKLEAAIKTYSLELNGATGVDIGASTGGFTDCMLTYGAAKVYAVDCGSGQLHPKLQADERVISIEKFNARQLSREIIPEPCGFAAMDVSFISQTLLHGAAASVMERGGIFVSLIKPQFEAGRAHIGKNGIVRGKGIYGSVIEKVTLSARSCGFERIGLLESPIKGGDGNTEFIAVFRFEE